MLSIRLFNLILKISILVHIPVISAAELPAKKNGLASNEMCLYFTSGVSQSATPMLDFMTARAKNPFGKGASFEDLVTQDVRSLKNSFLRAVQTSNVAEVHRVVTETLAVAKNQDLGWLFEKKRQLTWGNEQVPINIRDNLLYNQKNYQIMSLPFLKYYHTKGGLGHREELLRAVNLPLSTQVLTSEQERHLPIIWLGEFYENECVIKETEFIIAVREQGIQYIDNLIKQSVPQQQPQETQVATNVVPHVQASEQISTITKDYSYADNKPVTLSGSTEQHEIYHEAYTLLHEAHLMKDKAQNIPEACLYIESSEELSFSAIEVAQAGAIEVASDCADLAHMLLQHAEYVIEKSALVAAGAAKGGAKGVFSLVTAPIDYVRMGYRVCSIVGSTVKDALYNLATDPKKALNGYIESLESLGRLTFDVHSAERKALQGKIDEFIAKVGDGFENFIDLPLEDKVEFLTEFAVPFLAVPQKLAAKVPAIEKARKAVSKIVQNEATALKALAQTARAQLVEYQGLKLSSEVLTEVGRIEKGLGRKLHGQELISQVRKIEQQAVAHKAPLVTSTLESFKREQILPKVATYEQARNKALELIGEVDHKTGQPHIGKLYAGEGQVVGRRWDGFKTIMRLDYDPKKGPHINVTDFRAGKSMVVAIPFEGTEETFKTLLKHLQS